MRGEDQRSRNTVPADKNGPPSIAPLIPYRPANRYRTLRQKYRANRQIRPPLGANQPILETIANESPAKAVISGFAGTRNTIPYPPTSITVPPGKEYRTARQGIPYRPAKHSVLSSKTGARCSCKTDKNRRQVVRAPCICFLLNVLYVVQERELRVLAESGVQELRLFEFEGGPLIQVEVNLEEAPLFMFKRRDRHEDSTEARNTVLTKDGNRLEQYWRITAHRDFGLPGPQDQDVFVAVMTIVSRRGGIPPDGRISFTLYELLEILGKTHAGKNYDDLRNSLDRLSETSIYAENAFYSKADEDFRSHRFRMWSVHFSRKKRQGRASEHHTLRFDDILVRSYNASYLKSLDSDFYYDLKRPLARSLYKLIDVKRKEALSWSVELEGLRQLLSMPESYKYPSAIRRQLEPVHRELVEKGFLSRADFEERGRGATRANLVRYRVSQRFVRERSRPA